MVIYGVNNIPYIQKDMFMSSSFKVTLAGCGILITSIMSCFISSFVNKKINQVENINESPV